MHPEVEHLRKLPIAERLRVVEELWDDIGRSGESFPLPAWHRAEADRRTGGTRCGPVDGTEPRGTLESRRQPRGLGGFDFTPWLLTTFRLRSRADRAVLKSSLFGRRRLNRVVRQRR